jgi:hypothetical protein
MFNIAGEKLLDIQVVEVGISHVNVRMVVAVVEEVEEVVVDVAVVVVAIEAATIAASLV